LTKKLYLMNLEEAQRIIKKLGKENKRGASIKGLNRAMVETIESEIAQTLKVLRDGGKSWEERRSQILFEPQEPNKRGRVAEETKEEVFEMAQIDDHHEMTSGDKLRHQVHMTRNATDDD
jgi:hypothetical protein